MTPNPLNRAIRSTLQRMQGGEVRTDAQLLERFAATRAEAAFEEVVRRHGPMVLQACRRQLHDLQLAEDAFQATFIVLARKAALLARPRAGGDSVGGWLHTVATRIAARAKRNALRRRSHEQPLASPSAGGAVPGSAADAEWRDLRPVLDEALHRLPEKYRAPLVLCYLEGKTYEEAALQLQWPLGTLKTQLSRGREALRSRLTQRDVTLTAGGLAVALEQAVALAAVPPPLVQAALQAIDPAGTPATQAAALAAATLQAMNAARLKTWAIVAVVLVAVGVSLFGVMRWRQQPATATTAAHLGKHPDLNQILFAADGKTLISLGRPRSKTSVKVWDVAARRELASFDLAGRLLAVSPDSKTLAVDTSDGVRLHNALTGMESVALAGSGAGQHYAAFSPDGHAIAVAAQGAIRLWDTATGQELPVRCACPVSASGVFAHSAVAWSPDGQTLAALQTFQDFSVPLFISEEESLRRHNERARLGLSARLILLDAGTGKQRAVFADFVPNLSFLAFSPDSRWLATEGEGFGSVPGPLRVIEVATGREQRQFTTSLAGRGIGFLPDGKTLFKADYHNVAERDCRVVFFDTATGQEQDILRVPLQYVSLGGGLNGATTVVVVSPNGRTVAVGQREGPIELLGVPGGPAGR